VNCVKLPPFVAPPRLYFVIEIVPFGIPVFPYGYGLSPTFKLYFAAILFHIKICFITFHYRTALSSSFYIYVIYFYYLIIYFLPIIKLL